MNYGHTTSQVGLDHTLLTEAQVNSKFKFSAISCIISDADPCIKQVPNAFHTVSDCLVINWVEGYRKEQEILPVNIRGQMRKAYVPICCLWHSLVTLAFRKWQADTRSGGNGSYRKRKKCKGEYCAWVIKTCVLDDRSTDKYIFVLLKFLPPNQNQRRQVYGNVRITFYCCF